MKAEESYIAARVAVAYVRKERAPYFIEYVTYRFLGHGASDNRSYRTREEEETWKKRSPVENFRPRLTSVYRVEEGRIKAVEEEIETTLANALKFAAEGAA